MLHIAGPHGITSLKIKGFLQKIWHTDPKIWHTNASVIPYERTVFIGGGIGLPCVDIVCAGNTSSSGGFESDDFVSDIGCIRSLSQSGHERGKPASLVQGNMCWGLSATTRIRAADLARSYDIA